MGLLPDTSNSDLGQALPTYTDTSNTYKMQVDADRVKGNVRTNLEAVQQAIYKALNTERRAFAIYSWNYGIELKDLFGKPVPYCMAEIPRRIEEALLVDDRIESVEDFELSHNGAGEILCKFKAVTIYGDLILEKKVGVA